ncbi:MAG: hypothetical protein KC731_01190, partial [Myxococcales bacterium]|nr:hypothetical protein [Myxococcales bacterium]
RAYMRGQVEAWYAGSGRSTPQILRPLEEVIVLRSRAGGGGAVKVTGSGSYDVYRWNGRCVSVMEGELSLRNPGTADVALIPWRSLAPPIQDKLSEDQHIKTHNERRRDACREDRDSAKCDHASLGLSRRIAQYVRDGHPLPVPTSLGRPGR